MCAGRPCREGRGSWRLEESVRRKKERKERRERRGRRGRERKGEVRKGKKEIGKRNEKQGKGEGQCKSGRGCKKE